MTTEKQKRQTQKEFVLETLLRDGFITRNYCLQHYITRLTSIIDLLMKEGLEITAEYIKVDTTWGTGKDYKYTLVVRKPRVQASLF